MGLAKELVKIIVRNIDKYVLTNFYPNLLSRNSYIFNRNDYKKTIIGYAAKTARFNYVEWIKIGSGEMVGRELFDHRKDPNETLNLIDNIEYAETINFLAKKVSERIQNTHHDHKFKKIDSKY